MCNYLAGLSIFQSNLDDLSSHFSRDVIEIGGVQFQYLAQTIAYI